MKRNFHHQWEIIGTLLIIFIAGTFSTSSVLAMEQIIPIQSVYSNQFTTDVVFENSFTEISEDGQFLELNISIIVVFEQNTTILGVMHLYGHSNSWNLDYMIGNFENVIESWNAGEPQVHFAFNDPYTIHFSFLEIAPYIHEDTPQIRAFAFYSNDSQESIQNDIHTIYANYYPEFCDSIKFGETIPPGNTDTTNPSWISRIPSFPLIPLMVIIIWSSRHLVQKTKQKRR